MQMNPDQQLEEAKAKIYRGEEVSTDEYLMVVSALRQDRRAGAQTSKKKSQIVTNLPDDLTTLFD